jgi:hypothetical protein
MIRTVSPRHVYATRRICPFALAPKVTNRFSSALVSSIVRAFSSSRAVIASAKSTPCFRRFAAALPRLHS